MRAPGIPRLKILTIASSPFIGPVIGPLVAGYVMFIPWFISVLINSDSLTRLVHCAWHFFLSDFSRIYTGDGPTVWTCAGFS